jgi:hypothetical protein
MPIAAIFLSPDGYGWNADKKSARGAGLEIYEGAFSMMVGGGSVPSVAKFPRNWLASGGRGI